MKTRTINNCVLGIDASTSCVGWAILSDEKKPKLVDFGKILIKEETKEKGTIFIYKEIIIQLKDILETNKGCIRRIAMEQLNSTRNMKVTRILAGLAGVLRYVIYFDFGISVNEVNTKHAKFTVTGNGNADKEEVINKINKTFKLKLQYNKKKKEESDDDIADAIAIALTHIKDENGNV